MKKQKSVISLLLVIAIVFSCVGCGGKKETAPEPAPEAAEAEATEKEPEAETSAGG